MLNLRFRSHLCKSKCVGRVGCENSMKGVMAFVLVKREKNEIGRDENNIKSKQNSCQESERNYICRSFLGQTG